MNMRSCPRCRGAMYLDRDHYGAYEHCLLCGNFVDLDEPRVPEHGTLAENLSAPRNLRGRAHRPSAMA